ncbi:MAG TPA: hypothetical protein VG937_08025 [Polyangiaceae bacterium]|nr:hypothetical protein [Polyangiaceae bacterium]
MPDNDDTDPRQTVVIVGEDGTLYKLTKGDYKQFAMDDDDAGSGVVKQLTEFGSYLSFIPTDLAVGFGFNCTVVNVKAILKGNPPPTEQPAPNAPTG